MTLGFEANTLVQGTLGEPGTGRAGAQGLMLTCRSAWEHSTERGVTYFGLAPSSGEHWITAGVKAGSAQGRWEHLGL